MSCGQFESERRQNRIVSAPFTIAQARSTVDLDDIRDLFREYGRVPGVDVCVQGFDAEIDALPGVYAEPRGALLLARIGAAAVGCAGVKPVGADVAEMKRLFVRPDGRGRKIGEALTSASIDVARRLGYARLRLDTLPTMTEARAIYSRLGFREVEPWAPLPIAGAAYLEVRLKPDPT